MDKTEDIITDTQATSSSRISGPRHQAIGLQGRSCASRCRELFGFPDFGHTYSLSANVRLFSSYAKSFNATFTAGPTP